jgi:hypothetical protein
LKRVVEFQKRLRKACGREQQPAGRDSQVKAVFIHFRVNFFFWDKSGQGKQQKMQQIRLSIKKN